jgi:trehalose synthase
VDTPEGAALRIRQLLQNRAKLDEMGQKARRFAMENFLITRHLRDYLALMVSLRRDTNAERLELG